MKRQITFIITISIFICIVGCTENPFFKDKTITGNSFSGTVKLRDASDPNQRVYVWLEGFNAGTYTDENGEFHLNITSSSQFGAGRNGNFKVYFYVSNYYLDSARVVIVNNNIQYGEGDLNDKGKLNSTVYLKKLLNIDIEVNPQTIRKTYNDSIDFEITLDVVNDTVTVRTKTIGPFDLTSCVIKKTDDPDKIEFYDYGGFIYKEIPVYPEYTIADFKRRFYMSVKYDVDKFPVGEYQFIPYIIVSFPKAVQADYPEIPSGLLQSMGINVNEVNDNLANVPMDINGGKFTVTN